MPDLTNIVPIVEMLHNVIYVAAAYNQIWTVKAFDTPCGKRTIALVDERSGEEKLVFHNPDEKMLDFVEEVRNYGWVAIREKYLGDKNNFENARIHLCDHLCGCDCHKHHS